jgi:ABC-type sugar transport system ATPase subunit
MHDCPPSETAPVLALEGVTKHFGPLAANQEIRLEIYPGQVHALLGA